ncbi:uncharacterized protein [Venturia canescens]|uniref:uncharacterized protein n=1 Tax=Venturia canescens TaxID=32260 RepID=UPI001C9C5FF3|nr:uncharacterized protein LOC122410102 [Venturia canescens]
MTDMGLSLDDIIKKTKPSKPGIMRGRGGIRRGVSRGARANGVARPRSVPIVTDARFKIIQKNREKLTDARDKLAEIAKQSDARLKLDKLRASHVKKTEPQMGSISRKTGRNGRISLMTNKIPTLIGHVQTQNYMQPPPVMNTRNVGYKQPHQEPQYISEDMGIDYNEDVYMMDAPSLRRTVSNEYAPIPPPPPPVFSMKAGTPYTWVKQPTGNVLRSAMPRKPEPERPRDFKVVARSQMSKYEPASYREDWTFGSKSRTILAESPIEPKYFDPRSHREIGVKSRLDGMTSKQQRPMESMGRPKTSSTSSSHSTGYRIVVSNLQANVTQEDIKELFEDVGELLVSRLVRPGTAEVIYKTLKDATKAVETYHNRQLDGHPMKCLLVNPRSKNNPTGTAVRCLTEPRRTASSSSVQPSLGSVHRAIFDDIIVKLRPN